MLVFPTGTTPEDYRLEEIPDYRNSCYYNTSHSYHEIAAYLQQVNRCIKEGHFVVLNDPANEHGMHRQKNIDFMNIYGLYTKRAQRILLLSLDANDFCHSVKSSDGRDLYVFCCLRTLYRTGSGARSIWIYIKHDYQPKGHPFDVVVSLHELEMPIDLFFVD